MLGDPDVDILTIDDCGLSALPELQRLEVLSLQRCRWVGDAACIALARCQRLARLDLRCTDVSGRGVGWLSGLPCLHALDLSGCK